MSGQDGRGPALLLDVDGVLNPFRRPGWGTGFTRYEFLGYLVWLSARHGRWLRELAAEGVELVWATTWEHDANLYVGPAIGLPTLPVIEFGDAPRTPGLGGRIWKLPAVESAMAGRPFAWVDDDFGRGDPAWARERTAAGTPTLLVPCVPQVGLTAEEVGAVRAWLADLVQGATPAPDADAEGGAEAGVEREAGE